MKKQKDSRYEQGAGQREENFHLYEALRESALDSRRMGALLSLIATLMIQFPAHVNDSNIFRVQLEAERAVGDAESTKRRQNSS